MRGPLLDLLFTSGTEVGTVTPVAAIAAAEAGPVAAVASRAAITILVAAAHHRRRAGFMLVHANGEEADDVLVDVGLTLQLRDCGSRCVEVESDVMRLAVLGDPIGKRAQTPGLGLGDLAPIVRDDLGCVFRQRVDLCLCKVLTREENMLVERHALLSCWPIADAAHCGAPPAVV